jgi:hypothetical protein
MILSLIWIACLAVAALFVPRGHAFTQEPQTAPASQTAPAATDAAQPPAAPPAKPPTKKYSHANDFLIRGTVFTDKGLSFPNAQLRIRRSGEKKFRWETFTNSRGDFAIRVPQGSDYEILVRSKHFNEQTRTVGAKSGAREESMVFRMEPAAESKK